MSEKWTAPWVIKSYQGNYYISSNLLFNDSKGTACVRVDLSKKIAQIHPDDIGYIKEWHEIPEGSVRVELKVLKSSPSLRSRKLQQTMDTINFVSRYNDKLADYLIEQNKDNFQ